MQDKLHDSPSKGRALGIKSQSSNLQPLASASGFTLVEMAMVLVIMGFVMMIVFPALVTLRTANQTQLTQSNLHNLMLATAAFVQANGCLPCPAGPSVVGTDFGKLGYYTGINDPKTNTACGVCPLPEGIAPFVALGIPSSTAHDGWGHWITMRVDTALTSNFAVVPPTAACTTTDVSNGICTAPNISAKGLCKSGLATANRITVTTANGASQQAAVIFVSHGSSGYGSYFAQAVGDGINGSPLPFQAPYNAACSAGEYAMCNGAQNNSTQFVDAPQSPTYDDVLAYADRNTLVATFGNGSCQTTW